MSKQDNFEQLLEDRPADALKYFKELVKNPAWVYMRGQMQKELIDCDVQLRTCPLEKVEFTRGHRNGILLFKKMPGKTIEQIFDQIAMDKEAAKIEAARQPEEEKE